MSANIYEQAKEIGILRALGFTTREILLLYVYEAFIIVTAAALMGVMIGVVVGWSMSIQMAMT